MWLSLSIFALILSSALASVAEEQRIILRHETISISLIGTPTDQLVAVFGGTGRNVAVIVAEPPSNYEANIFQNRYSVFERPHRVNVLGLPQEILVFTPWDLSATERLMVVQNCIEPFIALTKSAVNPFTEIQSLGIINFRDEMIVTRAGLGSLLEFKLSERLAVGVHTLAFCENFSLPQLTMATATFRIERGEVLNLLTEWVTENKRLYLFGSLLAAILAGCFLTSLENMLRPVKDLIGRFFNIS